MARDNAQYVILAQTGMGNGIGWDGQGTDITAPTGGAQLDFSSLTGSGETYDSQWAFLLLDGRTVNITGTVPDGDDDNAANPERLGVKWAVIKDLYVDLAFLPPSPDDARVLQGMDYSAWPFWEPADGGTLMGWLDNQVEDTDLVGFRNIWQYSDWLHWPLNIAVYDAPLVPGRDDLADAGGAGDSSNLSDYGYPAGAPQPFYSAYGIESPVEDMDGPYQPTVLWATNIQRDFMYKDQSFHKYSVGNAASRWNNTAPDPLPSAAEPVDDAMEILGDSHWQFGSTGLIRKSFTVRKDMVIGAGANNRRCWFLHIQTGPALLRRGVVEGEPALMVAPPLISLVHWRIAARIAYDR